MRVLEQSHGLGTGLLGAALLQHSRVSQREGGHDFVRFYSGHMGRGRDTEEGVHLVGWETVDEDCFDLHFCPHV